MATWVTDTIYSLGYAGIVVLMVLENVFPPIPSEVIMPLAGFMVSQGKFSLIGIIAAGTAGSVLGALPFYYIGRWINEERLKALADRYGRWLTVSGNDIERSKAWFDKHGRTAIILGRLVPAVRSLISIPAGIARMNLAMFLTYTSVGTALWTALLAFLGYYLGSNFGRVGEYVDRISWLVIAAIVLIYIVRVIRHK
jgi:membrane protein DedA with SNARE-associated domain